MSSLFKPLFRIVTTKVYSNLAVLQCKLLSVYLVTERADLLLVLRTTLHQLSRHHVCPIVCYMLEGGRMEFICQLVH